MRYYDSNIVYKKVLSTESAANVEVLNVEVININSRPFDWFGVFLPVKSKI